jgi:UDP-N-acetylmuramyl pentapeptide phosphotransferase/UDP-N-acetylglucosamine-1-phosphate transferase
MISIYDGLSLITTFIISWLSTYWLASHRSPLRILDKPNKRSLHDKLIPRIGGVATLLSIMVGWILIGFARGLPGFLSIALFPLVIVGLISFLDDQRGISPFVRLLAQGVAAAWLVLHIPGEWLLLVGVWFAVVWMINLYNFMDGIDGLAGGMAIIGFGALGLIAWLNGHQLYSIYAWVVMAAASGFMVLNFPPARIFMGDIGSASLGLLVSIFWLWGVQEKVFSFWTPLLIFSPFIVDATVTLLRRAYCGERVWEAHCSHYYQYLVQLGLGHRKTVLLEYTLMLISAAVAILLNDTDDILVAAGGFCVLTVLYFVFVCGAAYYERVR